MITIFTIYNFLGKLSEVEAKNLILLGEIKNLNSSFIEEKEVQRNTVKGLERLGDSLASIKVRERSWWERVTSDPHLD